MHDIIGKTYELLDALDDSEMMRDLVYYKEKLLLNEEVLALIKTAKESKHDYEKVKIKKELYLHDDYRHYMDSYNRLADIVREFNYRMQQLVGNRRCLK